MASQKAPGDTMGASKRRYLQDTTTDNPDLTRLHGHYSDPGGK